VHQATHVLAIRHRRQPFRFLPFKLLGADQMSLDVEVMAGIFTEVAMKSRTW
jgi:hypothetical protein